VPTIGKKRRLPKRVDGGDRCFLKFKWPEDAATGAREDDDGGGGMDINRLANGPPGKLCHFYCLNNKTTAAANCFNIYCLH